jgi:tRNA modification GTPase
VVDRSRSDGAWRQAEPLLIAGDLLVLTKGDLAPGADGPAAVSACVERVTVSVRAEDGLRPLQGWLEAHVVAALGGADFPAVTRLRHRRLLEEAAAHLDRGLAMLGGDAELAAEDVRLAARALERLSGRIDPEAVLDRVFSSFCIGK